MLAFLFSCAAKVFYTVPRCLSCRCFPNTFAEQDVTTSVGAVMQCFKGDGGLSVASHKVCNGSWLLLCLRFLLYVMWVLSSSPWRVTEVYSRLFFSENLLYSGFLKVSVFLFKGFFVQWGALGEVYVKL